jgi:hypothetical protein
MLPKSNEYGPWPASGEIDIVESRGNDASYPSGGVDTFGSTLHWGPDWTHNEYDLTHAEYKHTEDLSAEFHVYGMYWDEDQLYTYFDDESNKILQVDFTQESMWDKGAFPESYANPWINEPNAAPFNREFYILMNVAVGGTNGYFPDGQGGKPWADADPTSTNEFYNARGAWMPTWVEQESAMQIDSVKVWSLDGAEVTPQ